MHAIKPVLSFYQLPILYIEAVFGGGGGGGHVFTADFLTITEEIHLMFPWEASWSLIPLCSTKLGVSILSDKQFEAGPGNLQWQLTY